MAAKAQIASEEYLRMSFADRPDAELVDGELRERSMPNGYHVLIQGILVARFVIAQSRQRLFVLPEVRVCIAPGEYRVPDIAVWADAFPGAVPVRPPLVVIEIISPDDRHLDVSRKCEEYLRWGVPHIWVVNPELKSLHSYLKAGLSNIEVFELPEYGIRITFSELVAGLPQN